MASLNRVTILGNLGKDPELRKTGGGASICNLSVATSDQWRDESGEKKEKTEWHRITVFGKSADNCAKYLAKGRSVLVEGKIETREWKDKEGQRRFTTEIMAQNVQFLGGGQPQAREETATAETVEDIPF